MGVAGTRMEASASAEVADLIVQLSSDIFEPIGRSDDQSIWPVSNFEKQLEVRFLVINTEVKFLPGF